MPPEQPLVIDSVLIDKMITHAESVTEECCGFLLGNDGAKRSVKQIIPAVNIADSNREKQFAIAPREYLTAEVYAERNDFDLIGIYHSHPNHPAVPSEHDRSMAQPNFSYVILSLKDNKFQNIRSWRLDSGKQFTEEQINRTH